MPKHARNHPTPLPWNDASALPIHRLAPRHALIALGVAILVALIQSPALTARVLTFDDDQYLTDNRLVRNPSWDSAGRFISEVLHPSTVGGYYQPLGMISLMLDCARGGTPENLRPFHSTSLALHALNAGLVALLVLQLFGSPWIAVAVALLFGLHPMTVEAVTWIAQRKTVLSTFFAFIALNTYLYWLHRRRPAWMVLTVIGYLLALLSKPTTIPLPVLLLLLDWWSLRRLTMKAVIEKAPLFILAAASAVITIASQALSATVVKPGGELEQLSSPLVFFHNHIFYLYKFFWPIHVWSWYPYPDPPTMEHHLVKIGVIGTLLLIPLVMLSLRWTRTILFAWLFYLLAILPAMGVLGFSGAIAADRHMYLPMIGILLAIGYGLGRLGVQGSGFRVQGFTIKTLVVAVLIGEASATRGYLNRWQDPVSLFEHMVQMTPDCPTSYGQLGNALSNAGKLDESIVQYRKAIELDDRYAYAYFNLANQLRERGNLDEAIYNYSEAARISDEPRTYFSLANTLLETGRVDQAIQMYERLLAKQPEHVDGQINMANALLQVNRYDEAIEHYAAAAQLAPADFRAFSNLGIVLVQRGRFQDALGPLQRALMLNPRDHLAHKYMGIALQQTGQTDQAMAHFRESLSIQPDQPDMAELMRQKAGTWAPAQDPIEQWQAAVAANPNDPEAYNNLAGAYGQRGRFEDAAAACREAIRLNPRSVGAHINLGNALSELGKRDDALAAYRKAAELAPNNPMPHFVLGTELERAEQIDAAIACFNRVLELNPNSVEARWHLDALRNRPKSP